MDTPVVLEGKPAVVGDATPRLSDKVVPSTRFIPRGVDSGEESE